MDRIVQGTRSLFSRSIHSLRAVTPYSRQLIRKPTVVAYWLTTAKAGLLLAALMLAFFPTLMPRAIDAVLPIVYPPVTEEKLFGLIKREKENPLLSPRRHQAIVILWIIGTVAVLALLWLHIPRAVSRAAERSRSREREADDILLSNPSQSLLLYRSALSWTTDSDHESRLSEKVDSLNNRLSKYLQREQQHGSENEDTEQTLRLLPASAGDEPRAESQARYRIEEQLGHGAMGAVHRATDTVLGRAVAIKVLQAHLTSDDELMTRFEQEARALARLSHPGIVQVYDFVRDAERVSIVMELVDGTDLQQHVSGVGEFTVADTVHIAIQLADAVDYAHQREVVHRDFKPANVLMTRDGQPKITDFGLAKISDSGFETMAGTVIGSPAYMSPEQALGQPLDTRTDIYSFGVVLYWMAAGKLPFDGDARDLMYAHVNEQPAHPADLGVDDALSELIIRLLQKDPVHRIATMQEVAKALRELAPNEL